MNEVVDYSGADFFSGATTVVKFERFCDPDDAKEPYPFNHVHTINASGGHYWEFVFITHGRRTALRLDSETATQLREYLVAVDEL